MPPFEGTPGYAKEAGDYYEILNKFYAAHDRILKNITHEDVRNRNQHHRQQSRYG
jgi:hypothetical protein